MTFRQKQVVATDVWSEQNIDRNYKPRCGIRITEIKGYDTPCKFYSPAYVGKAPVYPDKRRTLYWNPSVKTDDKGEAVIRCWNNSSSTQLSVSAETLAGRQPAAVEFVTIGK